MKVIGYSVTFVVLAVLSTLYSGYALSVLWEWFVAGTFGLPRLTINAAIGLAIIVGYMTKDTETKSDDRSATEIMIRGAVAAAVKPTLALLMGWIVKAFA